MRLRVWHHWPRSLEPRWAALLAALPQHTVFQTWEWNQAWWRAFGRGRRLCLVGVEDEGGGLVGLGPFMKTRRPRAGTGWFERRHVVELLGTANWASDYADVLVAPGDRAALGALVGWLRRRVSRFTAVDLSHLRDDSPHLATICDLARGGGVEARLDEMQRAPTRLLVDAASDRALLAKKSLRRHRRGLARAGGLEFRVAASVEEILSELPAFFDQHVRRRRAAGTASQFLDPAQRRFYTELTHRLFPRGWLHFSSLRFEGAAVAYHFGLQYRGSYLWYKPAFEPSLAHRSPGEVLLAFLIADVLERGFDELDFTVGEEPFKARFANHTRRILRMRMRRMAA